MKKYFVTAIGTDSGKTLVSAILTEALKADYWKPIQAGFPRDTETVQNLISNSKSRIHPETYLLNTASSPHAAAKIDNVEISLGKIAVPKTDNHLIIEGAGGLLVPLNDNDFVIDLAQKLSYEIILVSNLYLGSINHTLLSCEALKARKIKVKGLIFNGLENKSSELIIQKKAGYPVLMNIPHLDSINRSVINNLSDQIRSKVE
ncbi:MAG: dethiobiotin synthase [Bacteroidetes bacterium]|nr:dethiobiotin synthase [Bacteroidota bacterium]MDA1119179.1 dethiobiotin synthase [Bacteroidota bacterium]